MELGEKNAVITLRNAERKNALDGKMMAELADAVDRLESWEGTTVILQVEPP